MFVPHAFIREGAGGGGVVEGEDGFFGAVDEVGGCLGGRPADAVGDREGGADGVAGEVAVEAEECSFVCLLVSYFSCLYFLFSSCRAGKRSRDYEGVS